MLRNKLFSIFLFGGFTNSFIGATNYNWIGILIFGSVFVVYVTFEIKSSIKNGKTPPA